MSKVGPQLKQAREAQRKTRADVARETGILIHDLAALEYGKFDDLADNETAAGLVKVYAEYLGFRPDEPVAEFWAERGVDPPPPVEEAVAVEEPAPVRPAAAPPDSTVGARALPWGWILAGATILVLVIVAFVMRGDSQPPRATTAPAEPAEIESRPAPEATAPVPPEELAGSPAPQPQRAMAAEPAPASPESASAAPASRLRVIEHAVGTGVENRRLIGESERFRPEQRVWFWTRVQGGRAGDEVRHVWIRDGREIASVELAVGSANWRTQSARTMVEGSIGSWAVEARDASGRLLARSEFICEP